ISGLPFQGPIGAARVGYNDEQGYLLNPSRTQLESSELEMVVAGTETAVLMVESEAKELNEDLMLGAVLFGQVELQAVVTAVNELKALAGKPVWEWNPAEADSVLVDALAAEYSASLGQAYSVANKSERQDRVAELRAQAVARFANTE